MLGIGGRRSLAYDVAVQTHALRPYALEVASLELRRIAGGRTFRMLPALIVLLALGPLLLRANTTPPLPLNQLLLLCLLAFQAMAAPIVGGGVTPADRAQHRGLQLLLLTTVGPGSYLLAIYLTRVAILLLLSLIPLPVWLLGGAIFPESAMVADFWLILAAGPFGFAAMAMVTGQTTRSEVLGFLLYSSLLACLAVYLWGMGVARELTEIRALVLIFLLWSTWAALMLARLHFARTLAQPPGLAPPDAVHHALGSAARRIALAIRRCWPGAFDDPLLYLQLFRPPAPAIGMAWLVTGWLLFVGLVLDSAFAILPHWIVEADAESLQTHLWLVTACVFGVLLTPAALAMASFHGSARVHDLLRLTPYTDLDHFRVRELSVATLSTPLCLLPIGLQLAFTLDLWSAAKLGLLCLSGQLLALEVAFLFCGVSRLGEGLLWVLCAIGLLFVALPALGAPATAPATHWARATLPQANQLSLPMALLLQTAAGCLLARYHRIRFRVPT